MTQGTRVGTFYSRDWGEVAIWKTTYAETNILAVVLTDTRAKNLAYGAPIAIVSVNMPESGYLPPDCFFLKDWTENERLAEDLSNSGWLKPRDFDLPIVNNGHVQARPYQLMERRLNVIRGGAEPKDECPAPAPSPAYWAPGYNNPVTGEAYSEPAFPAPFRSGGGGDFGGGGAEASWDAAPAPAPSYAEAPSPAPAPTSAPASYDYGGSSDSSSSSGSGGGGGD